MQPQKSPYVRETGLPHAADPAPADGPVKGEVVDNIPVRTPTGPANPITAAPPNSQDKDLDKVLTDVNREVAKQPAESKDKKLTLPKKKAAPKPPGQKPVIAITVAVIVGLALIAAAYSAFKSGGQ